MKMQYSVPITIDIIHTGENQRNLTNLFLDSLVNILHQKVGLENSDF